jgi:NADH-quinone oxidoreductase subunit L
LLPYAPWLCWIAPACGALLVLLFGVVHRARKFRGHLAATSIGLSVLFSLSMIPEVLRGESIDFRLLLPPPIEVGVLIDPLSVLMAIIVSIIGLIVAVFSSGYMREDPSLTRFWFIMQLFISGYILLVITDNFLFMFIGWEIVGLCVTYLTSFEYKNKDKAHLGLKVNTILRVGDVALLIFILTVYAHSGTFNFIELSRDNSWIIQLSRSGLLLVSSLMFFGGVIGKAAQFPLHGWLPDMLVGTPSSSNALTECLAGPYLMARVLPIFHDAYISGYNELTYFFLTVAWIGAITAFVTALMATAQRHPQRVMAYSISSIIGYMLAALGLAGLNSSLASGYLAGTTILTIDAFVSALLILTVVLVSYAVKSEDLFNMSGFKSKLAHRGMEVAVFALISIPPFSGFWLCNWVQTLALELPGSALANGQRILVYSGYGLFALLILTGGVTAFYGLRVMGLVFSKGASRRKTKDIPSSMRNSFTALLVGTIILDLSVPFFIPLFNSYFLPIVNELVFRNFLDVLIYIVPSISTLMTITALIVGGYISRQLYIVRKISPRDIMSRYPILTKIHTFFLNRCYIDALYYKIAYLAISFSRKLYRNVEMKGIKRLRIKGIDELFNIAVKWMALLSRRIYPSVELGYFEAFNRKIVEGIAKLSQRIHSSVELGCFEKLNQKVAENTTKLSEKLRWTQTGVLSYNMLIMLIGIAMLAFLLLVFGGYLGT